MPPRRPQSLVVRGLALLLVSMPFFSVPYLFRVVVGAEWDTAILALLVYIFVSGVENIVSTRVRGVYPPTELLLTTLTLNYLWGIGGALVGLHAGITLLAILCAGRMLLAWCRSLLSIVERTWLLPHALLSKDPELVQFGLERQNLYQQADQALVDAGWVRGK